VVALKFGYGNAHNKNDWKNTRETKHDVFKVEYYPINRQPLSFLEEFDRGILRCKYLDMPLFVALSGGADSEFVAERLYNYNISFTPIIFEWQEGYNYADVWWAHRWCREHTLTPIILKLSWSEWLPKMVMYNKLLHLSDVESLLLCYIKDQIPNGILLTGDGNIDINKDNQVYESESLCTLRRYTDACFLPFISSPELVVATLSQILPTTDAALQKHILYKTEIRPKLTGYEAIKSLLKPIREKYHDMWGPSIFGTATIKMHYSEMAEKLKNGQTVQS